MSLNQDNNLFVEKTELINEESSDHSLDVTIIEPSFQQEIEELSEEHLVKVLEKLFLETLESQVSDAIKRKLNELVGSSNKSKESMIIESIMGPRNESDESVDESVDG